MSGIIASVLAGSADLQKYLHLALSGAIALLSVAMVSNAMAEPSKPRGASQLPEDDETIGVTEKFDRVLRVRRTPNQLGPTELPVWKSPPPSMPEAMVTPWPLIEAIQGGDATPVRYVPSTDTPPQFVVWLWNGGSSQHYMAFNLKPLGLSPQGFSALEQWSGSVDIGLPRSTCHWWSEAGVSQSRGDYLLVDALQVERSIGCFAAGLLRHVGNPLWSYVDRQYGSLAPSHIDEDVKRLYRCALRSQVQFVNAGPLIARTLEEKAAYLSDLGQRVRADCLQRL